MTQVRRWGAGLAAGTLVLALGACADDDAGTDTPTAEQTAANGEVFNEADVDFATGMIPHHAQALSMVDMTLGRDLTPELAALTQQIQAAQGPEIEQMVDWLTAWDQPVPETMRDHANAEDHGMAGHDMDDDGTDMPGMMSDEDMADLEAVRGPEFETMWLEMMIEHHRGAVEMAQEEQEDGAFGPAVSLAESIESSQREEIAHMEELLGS